MRTVSSSDGVEVVVHELRTAEAPPLLISHATGFHAWCYAPLAAELGDSFHSIALDYRGHGDTAQPDGVDTDWDRYTDDVFAVARSLPGPIKAFGHSMGGGCLLAASLRDPSLFSKLVLFEPIVPPPGVMALGPDALTKNPMSIAALRRRATFPSYEAALANYAAKPPLNKWRADALNAYVTHGFRSADDGVTLKCTPELEAATFATAAAHVWDLLDEVQVPVTILAGRKDGSPPPAFAQPIAEKIPGATFRRIEEIDHFGPMTHPDWVAAMVNEAFRE